MFPVHALVLVFMRVEPLLTVHRISMIFQSLCLSLICLLVSDKVMLTSRQGSRSFISSETSFDWFRICVNRFACLRIFSVYDTTEVCGSMVFLCMVVISSSYIFQKLCWVLLPRKVMNYYIFVYSFDLWIF